MKKILLTISIVALTSQLFAQNNTQPCPCCSSEYQEFDFWVGNWTVYSVDGKEIGKNTIVKMQKGCVLQENWRARNTGTSYNFFDRADSLWHQVWISSTGNVLNLEGGLDENGAMVLKSKLTKGAKGNYYNQVIWSKNEDGSVTQKWDILNEEGEPVSKAFEGIYRKSTD